VCRTRFGCPSSGPYTSRMSFSRLSSTAPCRSPNKICNGQGHTGVSQTHHTVLDREPHDSCTLQVPEQDLRHRHTDRGHSKTHHTVLIRTSHSFSTAPFSCRRSSSNEIDASVPPRGGMLVKGAEGRERERERKRDGEERERLLCAYFVGDAFLADGLVLELAHAHP
jgi:hypothetical protein